MARSRSVFRCAECGHEHPKWVGRCEGCGALKGGRTAGCAGIIQGRLEKYKDEVVLLRQAYIRDEAVKIEQLLHQAVGSIGENIIIRRFQRWELGEGLGE